MMAAGQEGSLTAMWIMGADPAHEYRAAGDVLGKMPFLVVQDLFMTDTASLAEVVLPATGIAETDGCFVNLTGRIQAVRAAIRPPGQARPDWWIITELARRMLDGKQRKAWQFAGPADVLEEISRSLPGYRGLHYATMGEEGWQRPVARVESRRAFARTEPDLPPRDRDYPLTLVAGRLLYDRGTLLQRSERIQKLAPDAFVIIHPADAEKLDLVDGDAVSLVSSEGRLGSCVRVSDEIVPGVAFAPLNLSDAPLSVLYARGRKPCRVRLVK
jgi:predicted molibdopterin-dependent oxidoreductase YjgC